MNRLTIRHDHRWKAGRVAGIRAARPRGFTLIELMITVSIIAILAAIALPSYQEYVRKSRRGDAQSFLSEIVARQQHFLLDRRAYADDITAATTAGGLGLTVPSNVSKFYTVTLTTDNTSSPPSFVLKAEPTGSQTGEKCGTLTIDQRGTKSATGGTGCW